MSKIVDFSTLTRPFLSFIIENGGETVKKRSIIRRVDNLGRIVIPAELRKLLDMDCGQDVEMTMRDDFLILRRFVPGCIFCGQYGRLLLFEGEYVCMDCRRRLTAETKNSPT